MPLGTIRRYCDVYCRHRYQKPNQRWWQPPSLISNECYCGPLITSYGDIYICRPNLVQVPCLCISKMAVSRHLGFDILQFRTTQVSLTVVSSLKWRNDQVRWHRDIVTLRLWRFGWKIGTVWGHNRERRGPITSMPQRARSQFSGLLS